MQQSESEWERERNHYQNKLSYMSVAHTSTCY